MSISPWERLTRRVQIMHQMWDAAISDLTTEQINHHERPGVLPIAFSLYHYVLGEDRHISHYFYGELPLWETADWAERAGGNLPSVRRGTAVAVAEEARVGSAAQWLAFLREVFTRTETALAQRDDDAWRQLVHETIPDQFKGSFVGMLAPEGPVYLSDIVDGFVFQHGIRHLGEIEHARSLLGLQGVS
jgi:hypothetical protein